MATSPDISYEKKSGYPGIMVAGVDEVGRGCLAGPVVAAAVVIPDKIDRVDQKWISQITDSKLLTSKVRESLTPLIKSWAVSWHIGQAEVEEIDRINIHYASHLAMVRAVAGLKPKPRHVLVDGKFAPKEMPCPATTIIKGDQKSLSIACASIIAKVFRDQMMRDMDAVYPGYRFAEHKGYATQVHTEALKRLGACDIHRRSFSPVAEALVSVP